MSLAMPTPVSDEAVEQKPGLYWWRRDHEKWTVVELYYRRKKPRVRFLGSERDEALDDFKNLEQLQGPPASLASSRT